MAPRILRRSVELLSMSALTVLGVLAVLLITGADAGEALGSAVRVFGVFCLAPVALWFLVSLVVAGMRRSRTDRELFRWELLLMGLALLLVMGFWAVNAGSVPFDMRWLVIGIALPYVLALALSAVLVFICSRLVFTSREPLRVQPLAEPQDAVVADRDVRSERVQRSR